MARANMQDGNARLGPVRRVAVQLPSAQRTPDSGYNKRATKPRPEFTPPIPTAASTFLVRLGERILGALGGLNRYLLGAHRIEGVLHLARAPAVTGSV